MRLCWFIAILTSALLVSARSVGGDEPAAGKNRTVVANDIVAVAHCTVDGHPKLLALRREQVEPQENPADPDRAPIRVVLLSVEIYPLLNGKIDPRRETMIWQNWHAFNPVNYRSHDAFSFVFDPVTNKPYLIWAHALSAVGGLLVFELDPRSAVTPADVSFSDDGSNYDGVPGRPPELAPITFSPVTEVRGVAGAYTAGPGINPSLMIYPLMGHRTDGAGTPVLRLDLQKKKWFYTDGREVKLDEEDRPINKPPGGSAPGAPGDK